MLSIGDTPKLQPISNKNKVKETRESNEAPPSSDRASGVDSAPPSGFRGSGNFFPPRAGSEQGSRYRKDNVCINPYRPHNPFRNNHHDHHKRNHFNDDYHERRSRHYNEFGHFNRDKILYWRNHNRQNDQRRPYRRNYVNEPNKSRSYSPTRSKKQAQEHLTAPKVNSKVEVEKKLETKDELAKNTKSDVNNYKDSKSEPKNIETKEPTCKTNNARKATSTSGLVEEVNSSEEIEEGLNAVAVNANTENSVEIAGEQPEISGDSVENNTTNLEINSEEQTAPVKEVANDIQTVSTSLPSIVPYSREPVYEHPLQQALQQPYHNELRALSSQETSQITELPQESIPKEVITQPETIATVEHDLPKITLIPLSRLIRNELVNLNDESAIPSDLNITSPPGLNCLHTPSKNKPICRPNLVQRRRKISSCSNSSSTTENLVEKVASMDKLGIQHIINNSGTKYDEALKIQARRRLREEIRKQLKNMNVEPPKDNACAEFVPDDIVDALCIPEVVLEEIRKAFGIEIFGGTNVANAPNQVERSVCGNSVIGDTNVFSMPSQVGQGAAPNSANNTQSTNSNIATAARAVDPPSNMQCPPGVQIVTALAREDIANIPTPGPNHVQRSPGSSLMHRIKVAEQIKTAAEKAVSPRQRQNSSGSSPRMGERRRSMNSNSSDRSPRISHNSPRQIVRRRLSTPDSVIVIPSNSPPRSARARLGRPHGVIVIESSSSSSTSSSSSSDSDSDSSASHVSESSSVKRRRLKVRVDTENVVDSFEKLILPNLSDDSAKLYRTKYSKSGYMKLRFISCICTSDEYNSKQFTKLEVAKIQQNLKSETGRAVALEFLMREIVNVFNKQKQEARNDVNKRRKSSELMKSQTAGRRDKAEAAIKRKSAKAAEKCTAEGNAAAERRSRGSGKQQTQSTPHQSVKERTVNLVQKNAGTANSNKKQRAAMQAINLNDAENSDNNIMSDENEEQNESDSNEDEDENENENEDENEDENEEENEDEDEDEGNEQGMESSNVAEEAEDTTSQTIKKCLNVKPSMRIAPLCSSLDAATSNCNPVDSMATAVGAFSSLTNLHQTANYSSITLDALTNRSPLGDIIVKNLQDVDVILLDLQKRKFVLDDMIRKLQNEKMETDLFVMKLQNERFVLLNNAVAANATAAAAKATETAKATVKSKQSCKPAKKPKVASGDSVKKKPKQAVAATKTPQSKAVATKTPQSKAVATTTPQSKAVATTTPQSKAVATKTPQSKAVATTTPQSKAVATTTPQSKAVATTTPQSKAVATKTPQSKAVATTTPQSKAVATKTPQSKAVAPSKSSKAAPDETEQTKMTTRKRKTPTPTIVQQEPKRKVRVVQEEPTATVTKASPKPTTAALRKSVRTMKTAPPVPVAETPRVPVEKTPRTPSPPVTKKSACCIEDSDKDADEDTKQWIVASGSIAGIKSPITQICVFEDCIVGSSENGLLSKYNAQSLRLEKQYSKHSEAITQLYYCVDRKVLYSTSLDGYLKKTSIENLEPDIQCVYLQEPLQSIAIQWGTAFIGSRWGNIFTYDIATNRLGSSVLCSSDSSIIAIKAVKEGPRNVLIVSSKGSSIHFRDAVTGLLLRVMVVPARNHIYSIMQDFGCIYCGTQTKDIYKFDFTTGAKLANFTAGNGAVSMRLYKNKYIFAGCYDGLIYVLDKKSGEQIARFPGSGKMVLTLEIVGDKVITSAKDNTMKVIDIPQHIIDKTKK